MVSDVQSSICFLESVIAHDIHELRMHATISWVLAHVFLLVKSVDSSTLVMMPCQFSYCPSGNNSVTGTCVDAHLAHLEVRICKRANIGK